MPHCPFHSKQTPSYPQATCILSSSIPFCPQSSFLGIQGPPKAGCEPAEASRQPASHDVWDHLLHTLQSTALLNGQLGSYLVFKLIAKRFNRFNWNKAVKIKCHLWVSGHLASLCLNLELNIDTSHLFLLLLSRIQQLAPRKLLVPMNLWMVQTTVHDSSSLIDMKITRD